jgi:beta-N-acetylhexosaminidase
MRQKVLVAVFILLGSLSVAHGQSRKMQWVDSVFNRLGEEEKIGQMFMVTVPSHASPDAIRKIENDIKTHEIGGVIFQQETPYHQAAATRRLQGISKIPLFVGQDAEWGLGQMIDSTVSFPRSLVLGAIKNDSMIYRMGKETARQMKMIGLNLNFGPIADVNNNPQDPLISYQRCSEGNSLYARPAGSRSTVLRKTFFRKRLNGYGLSKGLPHCKSEH